MSEAFLTEDGVSVAEKKPTTCGQKFLKAMKDNLFTILTLIGVAIGFGIGFGVGTTHPSEVAITWISGFNFLSNIKYVFRFY